MPLRDFALVVFNYSSKPYTFVNDQNNNQRASIKKDLSQLFQLVIGFSANFHFQLLTRGPRSTSLG